MRSLLRTVLPLALALLLPACGVVDSVFPPAGPKASFTTDPASGTTPAPIPVTFDASGSTGAITGYRWLVNGVQVGTEPTLRYTFDTPGNHQVTLVVVAGEREDTSQSTYTVLLESGFDITLVFAEGAFTATQQAMIRSAAHRWEQLVVGDIPDNSELPSYIRDGCLGAISGLGGTVAPELQGTDVFDDLLIYVYSYNEVSTTLAQAGPCWAGDALPNYGFMRVNQHNIDMLTNTDALKHVAIHEIGHVLGIGTLWRRDAAELMRPGINHCNDSTLEPTVPRTNKGARAVSEFGALGGVGEPPVSPGCSHWDQATFGNESLVPARRINPDGDNLTPVSRVTLGSLQDLGYVVAYEMADAYSLPVHGAHVHDPAELYHHGEPILLTPTLPAH